MNSDASQILAGTTVYDAGGEKIGTVHETNTQEGYLVVQKGWLFPRDSYVPLTAIARSDAEGVYLSLTQEELGRGQYDQPPLVGTTALGDERMVARGRKDEGEDIRIPVREEELVVGTRAEEAGRVHVRKEVTTEQQTVSVPLRQERVSVERVPFSGDAEASEEAFTERDIEVPVMGEEAVVGKQVRGVEEVLIRKDVVTAQEQVRDTVRKERVTVDGVDADGQTTAKPR